jgi:hypothetical protein
MTTHSGPGGLDDGGHHARWRTGRRAHGDDGAVLVEFALVMPVLALILFGIIEFGINLNDYQSVRQGVREGARQGVVADYGSVTTCGINGSAVSAGAESKAVICTTKERSGVGDDLRVKVWFVAGDAEDGSLDRVKVCATRPAASVTGLLEPFLSDVNLRSEIEMRAEKLLDLDAEAEESDPSGDDWSWCTQPG